MRFIDAWGLYSNIMVELNPPPDAEISLAVMPQNESSGYIPSIPGEYEIIIGGIGGLVGAGLIIGGGITGDMPAVYLGLLLAPAGIALMIQGYKNLPKDKKGTGKKSKCGGG